MGLFNFSKVNHQEEKEAQNDNFLVSEDKKRINNLTKEKSHHLKIAQKLDQEIIQIQKSTRTLIPSFVPLHNNLRQKYKWYYLWHIKKFSNLTHWLILLLFVFSLPFIFANLSNFQNKKAQATGYDFPRWEWIHPTPTDNPLHKSTTCPNGFVWAVGYNGTIIKSIDAGQNWSLSYSGSDESIRDIYCIDDENIIAVGFFDTILFYNNTSSTWSTISGGSGHYQSLAVLDSDTAVTVGDDGVIARIIRSGESWTATAISGGSGDYWDITTLDSDTAVAVGWTDITRIERSGESWSATAISGGEGLYTNIAYLDENTAVTVGYSNHIARIERSGESWNATPIAGGAGAYMSVTALDSNTAVTVGDDGFNGVITRIERSGESWSATPIAGGSGYYQSVATLDSNTAIAVANLGNITRINRSDWSVSAISGSSGFHYDITALDSETAVAVGYGGVISRITRSGESWSATAISEGGFGDYTDLTELDENSALGVGLLGMITRIIRSGESWTATAMFEGSDGYYAITALDSNTAVAVGDYGTITRIIRSGESWTATAMPLGSTTYKSVTALDSNTAVAVGDYGTITRIIRSGESWTATAISGGSGHYLDATALDSNTAVAVSSVGAVTRIERSGESWSATDIPGGSGRYSSITTLDGDTAVAISSIITRIERSGESWTATTIPGGSGGTKVAALDSDTAVAVGNNDTITRIERSGESWSATDIPGGPANYSRVYKQDVNTAVVTNSTGDLAHIIRSGESWNIVEMPMINTFGIMDMIIYSTNDIIVTGLSSVVHYHSPTNATAKKFKVVLPGEVFDSESGYFGGSPDSVQAGESVPVEIFAVDNTDILDRGNASWAGFKTTDPSDINPANLQLLNDNNCSQSDPVPEYPCGVGTRNFVFKTAGAWTITASDVNYVLSSGTSSQITVNPGSTSQLSCEDCPSTLGMGSASGAITLRAKDQYGNNTTVSGNKTIRLSTSSSGGRFATSASGPWTQEQKDVTISSGQSTATFYYLDFATNTATITAAETPSAGWTDGSCSITITSGTLDQSTLTVDKSSVAPGESLVATVTLKNSQGLALADRTVQLLSSRSTDNVSSSIITNASGNGSFTVTPTETGDLTLTAYNQTDNAYVPQTAGVHVGIGALARIDLTTSASEVNAGSPLTLNITLNDSFNNIISDFSGTLSFSSSDEKANFETASHTLTSSDQGRFSQKVTLNNQGDQSITASIGQIQDTVDIKVLGETETIPTTTTSGSPTPTSSPTAPLQTLLEKIAESPVAQQIAETLTPIATAAAALGFLPLLIQAFPQGFHVFASLFPAIFATATIRRRRKPWGTVFDSLTGKPIELAVVRIFNDNTDKLVGTKVTDQNGRFNILVLKGTYYLKVAKPGYIFPARMSKIKAGQLATRFGPETDVYLGQSFMVTTANANINLNVALDPKPNTLSNGNRLRKVFKDGFDWFLIGISYVALPMLIIGAAFTALSLVIKPTHFNMVLAIIYVLLLSSFIIVRRIRQTKLGIVFDSKTRKPIKNAIVSCFDKEYNALRETKTTDQNGYFSILAPKGEYYLTADVRGYRFPSKELEGKKEDKILGQLYFGDTIRNKKSGYLKVSIPLDKKY